MYSTVVSSEFVQTIITERKYQVDLSEKETPVVVEKKARVETMEVQPRWRQGSFEIQVCHKSPLFVIFLKEGVCSGGQASGSKAISGSDSQSEWNVLFSDDIL